MIIQHKLYNIKINARSKTQIDNYKRLNNEMNFRRIRRVREASLCLMYSIIIELTLPGTRSTVIEGLHLIHMDEAVYNYQILSDSNSFV